MSLTIFASNTGPRVVSPGNLGASYQLDLQSNKDVELVGTLNANLTLTFANVTAGARVTLYLTQDATGGRTVSLPAATYPAGTFAISKAASALTVIAYETPDAATWYAYKVSDPPRRPADLWLPSGAVAETYQRNMRNGENGAILSTGRMHCSGGMVIPAGVTVSTLTFVSATTAGATLTHMWAALIGQDKSTIIRKTADDTANAWAANTAKTFTLSTPYTPSVDTAVYCGLTVVGTTMPTIQVAIPGVNQLGVADLDPDIAFLATAAGLTDPASLSSVGATTVNGNVAYCYAA